MTPATSDVSEELFGEDSLTSASDPPQPEFHQELIIHSLLRLAWDMGSRRGHTWRKRSAELDAEYNEHLTKLHGAAEGTLQISDEDASRSLKALMRVTIQYTNTLSEIKSEENLKKVDVINEQMEDVFSVVKMGKGMDLDLDL